MPDIKPPSGGEPLRAIQLLELELLKSLRTLLDENRLRYFLAFGTLLGAVRHQGFIPWDDDVDIFMPREDYNRLMELGDGVFTPPFELHGAGRTAGYYELYAKYVDTSSPVTLLEAQRKKGADTHLWIDIFPLDRLPENGVQIFFLKKISPLIRRIYKLSVSDTAFKRNFLKTLIIKTVSRIFPPEKLYRAHLKLTGSRPSGTRLVSASEMDGSFYQYPAEIFSSSVQIRFEDQYFSAPADFSRYLSIQYGNYLELPPEGERKNHLFEIASKKI